MVCGCVFKKIYISKTWFDAAVSGDGGSLRVPCPQVTLQSVYPVTVQEYREGIRLSLLYMSAAGFSSESVITPVRDDSCRNDWHSEWLY